TLDGVSHFGTGNVNIGPQLAAGRSDHRDEREKLQKADNRDGSAKKYRDVVIERLVLTVLLVFGGFFLALYGPDNQRSRFRSSIIGGGLLAALGLGLWWATLLPSTWGWPL